MKNKNNKIVIGIILSLAVIGIGTFVYINNKTPEEVTVVENVEESTPAEEEVVEEVEEVEEAAEVESPKTNVLNVPDATEFLETEEKLKDLKASNTTTETVVSDEKTTETPVEVIEPEPEVIETPAEETPEYIDYSEKYDSAYGYVPSQDGNNFETVPVKCSDLSSNSNLIALQSEINPIFAADGAISEAFTLSKNGATIAYGGKAFGIDCNVVVSERGYTTVSVRSNLNDNCWKCLSAVMDELYDNGAAMISEIRNACEYGSDIYANEDTWVQYLGVYTKFVFDSNDYTLLFYFK